MSSVVPGVCGSWGHGRCSGVLGLSLLIRKHCPNQHTGSRFSVGAGIYTLNIQWTNWLIAKNVVWFLIGTTCRKYFSGVRTDSYPEEWVPGKVLGLWATWSSWRCPCSLQGGWARWPLKVPSNPKHSMILWSTWVKFLMGQVLWMMGWQRTILHKLCLFSKAE